MGISQISFFVLFTTIVGTWAYPWDDYKSVVYPSTNLDETNSNFGGCSSDEFFCGEDDGLQQCIPLEYQCDGVFQCSNGNDEMECDRSAGLFANNYRKPTTNLANGRPPVTSGTKGQPGFSGCNSGLVKRKPPTRPTQQPVSQSSNGVASSVHHGPNGDITVHVTVNKQHSGRAGPIRSMDGGDYDEITEEFHAPGWDTYGRDNGYSHEMGSDENDEHTGYVNGISYPPGEADRSAHIIDSNNEAYYADNNELDEDDDDV